MPPLIMLMVVVLAGAATFTGWRARKSPGHDWDERYDRELPPRGPGGL